MSLQLGRYRRHRYPRGEEHRGVGVAKEMQRSAFGFGDPQAPEQRGDRSAWPRLASHSPPDCLLNGLRPGG